MVNNASHINPVLALSGLVASVICGAWGLFVLMLTALGCMAAETGSLDGFHQWFCRGSDLADLFSAVLILLPVAVVLSQTVRAVRENRWLPVALGLALAVVSPLGILVLTEGLAP